jgi:hypothetical protein
MALAACGAPDSDALDSTTSTGVPASTSNAAPTTVRVTTTTEPPTTSTLQPTTTEATLAPTDPRQEFLDGLETDGWVRYSDDSVGWSIMHPPDWAVVAETPGDMVILEIPDGKSHLLIFLAQDGVPGETSLDYIVGNVQNAIQSEVLEELPEETLWLDHDFDGVDGPLDIYGGESTWAADLVLDPVQTQTHDPTTWYGYFNTDLNPAYGYLMQTVGLGMATVADIETRAVVDDVVLSFEPPAP